MENLLYAIDLDSGVKNKRSEPKDGGDGKGAKGKEKDKDKSKDETPAGSQPNLNNNQAVGLASLAATQAVTGIVNLSFEECKFTRKAAILFSEWLKNNNVIQAVRLVKVGFEDIVDFKKVTEGMKLNQKLSKLKVGVQV